MILKLHAESTSILLKLFFAQFRFSKLKSFYSGDKKLWNR